ncbi:MAG: glycosyltransferase family 2 protein [Deltaproteobacteria bacterium]|nr:glycosyltransferase family 2 protein [Deltaproteobacteria bacterium]
MARLQTLQSALAYRPSPDPAMETEPATISVIVATRDRAPSLGALLRSFDALEAPPVPYEIVIADNGSTDETPRLLADWRRGGPGRIVIRVGEPGKSRAANAAITASRGELLAFLDDDVVTDPRWLVEIWDYFTRHDCVAAQGAVLWPPEASADPELRERLVRYGTIVHIDYEPDSQRQRLTGANMVVRRHAFAVVGGFNEILGPGAAGASEDTELGTRILAVGGWIGYMTGARVVHEIDQTRLTEAHFAEHHRRLGRSRFAYKKNGLLSSILPNLAKSAMQYGLYSILGDSHRKYRAKGRLYHYGAMLTVHRGGRARSSAQRPRAKQS